MVVRMKLALESFQDIFYFLGRIKNKLPTIPKMCFFRLRRGLRALALRHSLLSPHPGHLSPPLASASSSQPPHGGFFTVSASELHPNHPPLLAELWRDKPAARRRRISPERQRRFRRFVRTDFALPTARFRPTNSEQRRGATLTQRRRSLRSSGVTSPPPLAVDFA